MASQKAAIHQCVDGSAMDWGVRPVLRAISAAEVPGAEIARRSGITAQSMGAAVSQLVERGLLRREPHPTSRRSMRLFATAEGEATAARAASIARRIERETTSPLSPDDKDSIHRLLYRLVEELNPDALAIDSRSLN
ncbi:MarR family winged helix-turn-helix transcriptional regulator [Streptomyces sp. NPDC005263]|uniref:MarR family winged helix-turn-helix transcriptional regulator n=1 Tax=Streptomyces sp. NPDC005263 TaxID=3364711 RepID=UPI0036B1B8D4